MKTEKKKDRIDELLTALENAASVPVVPGELNGWCDTVGEAFGALGEEWARKDDELEAMFQEIENDDVELLPRVERLRKKQEKISVEFVRLEQIIAGLVNADHQDPEGSWEPTSIGQVLRQDLLHLALRCRTLDREATMWAIEATHRDRGTGD